MPPKTKAKAPSKQLADALAANARLRAELSRAGKNHQAPKIKGTGDYIVPTETIKKIGDVGVGKAIGSAIGSVFGGAGSAVGGFLGDTFHRGLKYLTGWGDYNVRNTALNNHLRPSGLMDQNTKWSGVLPEFAKAGGSTADGDVIVFDEVVGTVKGSTGFRSTRYRLDAADASTFPWLAGQAVGYQQYQIEGMLFHFRTTYGSAGSVTTGTLGKVTLSTNYDPTERAPPDMRTAEDSMYSSSYAGDTSFVHIIECKPSATVMPLKNIHVGQPEIGSDRLFSTLGDMYVSTEGFPTDNAAVGTLYCTYKVRLLKPTIQQRLGGATSYYRETAKFLAYASGAGGNSADFIFNAHANNPAVFPDPTYYAGLLGVSTRSDIISVGNVSNKIVLPGPGEYTMRIVAYATANFTGNFGLSFNSGMSFRSVYDKPYMGVGNQISVVNGQYLMSATNIMWDGTSDGTITVTGAGVLSDCTVSYSLDISYVGVYQPLPGGASSMEDAFEQWLMKKVGVDPPPSTVVTAATRTTYERDRGVISVESYPYPPDYPFPPEGDDERKEDGQVSAAMSEAEDLGHLDVSRIPATGTAAQTAFARMFRAATGRPRLPARVSSTSLQS